MTKRKNIPTAEPAKEPKLVPEPELEPEPVREFTHPLGHLMAGTPAMRILKDR